MSAVDLSLHLVTDEREPFARLVEAVDAAVAAGVGVVQLRAKAASARELLAQAVALSATIDGRAAFVIDDRVDVALAARDSGTRVDGVHIGQNDVPPLTARRLLGPDALIGWTANTPAHFAGAAALPAGTVDYLGVGVIHPTATKADHPDPLGVEGFGALASSTTLPCIAIGGVTWEDAAALRAAGAQGLAVVTAICAAHDPGAATRRLRDAWSGALTPIGAAR